jgi:hypothetical protein
MKLDNLIKKLENIELPDIEIQSHKQKLKMALLNSRHFKPKTSNFWLKNALPFASAFALAIFLLVAIVNPKLMEAKAMGIAKNDPQVKKIMSENGFSIKELKIKNGVAFALLAPTEQNLKSLSGEETGSVARINLNSDKVETINDVNVPLLALTDIQIARAIEIIKNDPSTKDLSASIGAEKIILKSLAFLMLNLAENDEDKVELSFGKNQNKIIIAIFENNGSQYTVIVNLTKNKVEKVETDNSGEHATSSSSRLAQDILKEIEHTKEKIGEVKNFISATSSQSTNSLVEEAEKHLEKAEAACEQEKLSEAFGQNNAAFHDADNALKIIKREDERDRGRGETATSSRTTTHQGGSEEKDDNKD